MAVVALASSAAVLAVGVCLAATGSGWCWAPLSDAVLRQVPEPERNRTLSLIATGTTFGILVSAPVAWVTADAASWRLAWLVFAVLAVGSAAWNARTLMSRPAPGQAPVRQTVERSWQWLVRPRAAALYAAGGAFGLTSSFYWTFAVDRLSGAPTLPDQASSVFWLVVGSSGVIGTVTGALVARVGMRHSLVCACTALIAASASLAFPASWALLVLSAALFGAGFMVLSALLVIWSADVFPERPGAGLTATLSALGVGAIIGPVILGVYAQDHGLPSAFALNAVLTATLLVTRPRTAVGARARA